MIKVYKEHVFDEFNVYTVGNVQTPTASNWANGFNSILKQMVARVEPSKVNIKQSNTGWDVNNNGILDVIELYAFENEDYFDRFKYGDLDWQSEAVKLADVNQEIKKSGKNTSHAHFIVPGKIRTHYILTQDYRKDGVSPNVLYLHNTAGIDAHAIYRISKFFYPSSTDEEIEIIGVSNENKRVTIATPLRNDYNRADYITIYSDNVRGYVESNFELDSFVTSCSYSIETNNYVLYVHEFLHHWKNGFYQHVLTLPTSVAPYSANLMRVYGSGAELRYRILKMHHKEGSYSQWSKIREAR
ncbi:MAG: hypothetical protein LBI42_08655 [Chitinispirillales bacterium]|jgi:hypothetical protein|nr:hypothetical protein [Chitinispirillales bacterium]